MQRRATDAIYQFLDTNGDGTGTQNANEDYSVTEQEFYFQATDAAEIYRMIIHISDTTGIQAQDYGNISGGLTNGYNLDVQDENQSSIRNLTNTVPIQTNGDIGRVCYDVDLKTWGAGDEFIQARWTFSKAGYPILLAPNWRLSITFNDDLSGLLQHYFMVQGYYVT